LGPGNEFVLEMGPWASQEASFVVLDKRLWKSPLIIVANHIIHFNLCDKRGEMARWDFF
jgi:hypothetical protein